ncbi:MAG: DUF748 domain-containing protein [Sulfurovum sp.]
MILDVELYESIKSKTLLINEISVDKLNVNIAQNKEEFDLINLVKQKKVEQEETLDTQENNLAFILKNFTLKNSKINFLKDNDYKIVISNINNTLTNLSNLSSVKKDAKNILNFNIDENTNFKSFTSIKNKEFKEFEINSNLDISKIDLKKLAYYKKELLGDIKIYSIFLDTKVNIKYKTQNNELVVTTKDTNITNIDLSKSSNIEFKANSLFLDSSEFNMNKNKLILGDINLNNSDISYVHEYNLKEDVQKDDTNVKAKETAKENEFILISKEIKINNTNLDFEDKTLSTIPFKTNIEELNGFISSINTREHIISDLKLEGDINKYAKVNIDAKVNLNDVKILSDIDLKIQNLAINDFTPYSRQFIAQDIDDGKLDVDLKYNISKSNLDAKNNIIIKEIVLGKTHEIDGVDTLPLSIAIALLEDSNEEIEINLPVTGNLNNPEFSVAPIIWKAFTNLILKAITAPFSLLGSIFDFNDDEINKVVFNLNETKISPIQKEPLDKLVKILTNRPNMALEYSYIYSSVLEKQEIIEEKYKKFLELKPKSQTLKEYLLHDYKKFKVNDEKSYDELMKKYENTEKEEAKDKKLVEFLKKNYKENIEVKTQDYEELAIKRAQNIKTYLLENKVKNEQVKINEEFLDESSEKETIIINFKVNSI